MVLRLGHDMPNVKGEDDWTRDSDHYPFHQAGIPFVYFGVEDEAEHHKATDDAGTVTKEFFIGAANTILAAIRAFDANLEAIARATLKQSGGSGVEQLLDGFERVGVLRLLVGSPPQHAREPNGDPGSMPCRARDRLEPQLEYVDRLDMPDWSKAFPRVPPDPAVHLRDFVVREPGVRLRDRDELALVPDAEGVVGQEARASTASGLRVDEDRVDRERIDLPLPPVAALSSDAVLLR